MQELNDLEKNSDHIQQPLSESATDDPFAIDFFSPKADDVLLVEQTETSVELSVEPQPENTRFWFQRLSKVALPEATLSNHLSKIRLDFSPEILEQASSILSEFIFNQTGKATLQIASIEETNLNQEAASLQEIDSLFLTVSLPKNEKALFSISSELAVRIIETAFAGEKSNFIERRKLSQTELVIIEFLMLAVLKTINQSFGKAFFQLNKIETKLPDWFSDKNDLDFSLTAHSNSDSGRGLTAKFEIQIGEFTDFAAILLPLAFIENLAAENNSLTQKAVNYQRLQKIFAGTEFRLLLGETELTAPELSALEPGDIVLIAKPWLNPLNNFSQADFAELKIGAGQNSALLGSLTLDRTLKLTIREIRQDAESDKSVRLKMDEQLTEQTEESAIALEKITVNLKVELASRRVSLEELANIRAGQIIDLGTKPTDPIELVSDGKTVAFGELIDVEGSLGVRVTRVLI